MKCPWSAVFFDLDETLITNPVAFEELVYSLYSANAECFPNITWDAFWEAFWPRAVDMWNMMIDGVLPGDVCRHYAFLNTLRALDLPETHAERLADYADGLIADATVLADGAADLLQHLREAGVYVGIITNGYTTVQRRKIYRHGLQDMVDLVVVSEETGYHKPDARVFAAAVDRAGVACDKVLYVGDTPINDIRGACDAGWDAALIDFAGRYCDGLPADVPAPCASVRGLDELRAILGLPEPSKTRD